jgi:hypothetical protein
MLVFYVGYILDDKNTLCNGCIFNRIIGLIQNLQVIWSVFISSHVPCHKFLEVAYEDSMHKSKSASRFLFNLPDGSLKASGSPIVLEASALKTSGRQGNTVWMMGQASPISTRSWISVNTYLGSFCKTSGRHIYTFERYLEFKNIPVFLYERGKEIQ